MRKDKIRLIGILGVMVSLWTVGGCQQVYYDTMEAFGHPKRELLVDRVEEARDAQLEAKEQFNSALEKFSSVVNFTGGQLESKYLEVKAELEKSRVRAKTVHKRIAEIEDVALALFDEGEDELHQYRNEALRRISEDKLSQTRRRYARLIVAMHRAEDKMGPVLAAFGDHVLFLKHNLNAQAIASLQEELVSVEADIAVLIEEMEVSIAEANAFINAITEQ